MRSITSILLSLLFLSSCTEITVEDQQLEMKKADVAFSDLSKKEGMRKAFLQYIDTNGVLLRPDHLPIIGKDAREYIQQTNDSAFTLTWAPQEAIVARSGELGYTYGLYTFTTKDTSFQGTYVSIWRKQEDGSWKYVLDTGNPGISAGNK